jgi:hypothetical protein
VHRGLSLSLALFLIILPGAIAPFGAFGEKGVDAVLSASRFPARDRERISEVFAAAHAEGIAEEMLRSRLEEGIAKRVAAPLLLSALRRDVSFLQSARATLLEVAGGAALLLDNASWSRAADLLSWGASPDNLARLAHSGASRPELFKATTYLFALLIQWGLEPEVSVELCEAVAASQIDIDSYPGILDILVRGRRLLVPPRTLSRRIVDALPRVRDLQQLEQRTLYE